MVPSNPWPRRTVPPGYHPSNIQNYSYHSSNMPNYSSRHEGTRPSSRPHTSSPPSELSFRVSPSSFYPSSRPTSNPTSSYPSARPYPSRAVSAYPWREVSDLRSDSWKKKRKKNCLNQQRCILFFLAGNFFLSNCLWYLWQCIIIFHDTKYFFSF